SPARQNLAPRQQPCCQLGDYCFRENACLPRQPVRCRGGGFGMFSAASGSIAMKRFVLASVCVFALVGVVLAEEIQVTITGVKTDGNVTTISYVTKAKKGEEGKKGTAVLAEKAKVVKGMFNKDD